MVCAALEPSAALFVYYILFVNAKCPPAQGTEIPCGQILHGQGPLSARGHAIKGRDLEVLNKVVDRLLEHGADLEAPDAVGRTPLAAAVDRGDLSLCGVLLTRGASVNALDYAGYSCLSLAAAKGRVRSVSMKPGEHAFTLSDGCARASAIVYALRHA